jgi:hypothetical protein
MRSLFLLLVTLGIGLFGIATVFGTGDDVRLGLRTAPTDARPPTVAGPREAAQPAVLRSETVDAARPAATPQPVALSAPVPEVRPEPAATAAAVPAAREPVAPQPATAPSIAAGQTAALPEPVTIRVVNVAAVNMRGGPSTGYEVIGRLTRGEPVQVLEEDPAGWVLVRLEGDGGEGWVAGRFLSPE